MENQDISTNLKPKSLSKNVDNLAFGLIWNVRTDTLKFKINVDKKTVTKRSILSTINGVYDPLGSIGPAIIPAKKVFRDSCRLKLGWDEQLPTDHSDRWLQWKMQLPLLEDYEINRCYKPSSAVRTELHFFFRW